MIEDGGRVGGVTVGLESVVPTGYNYDGNHLRTKFFIIGLAHICSIALPRIVALGLEDPLALIAKGEKLRPGRLVISSESGHCAFDENQPSRLVIVGDLEVAHLY